MLKCREEDQEDEEELFLAAQCGTHLMCERIRHTVVFLVLKSMQPTNKFPEHFSLCRGSFPSSGSNRPDKADMTELMNRDVQQELKSGTDLNDQG